MTRRLVQRCATLVPVGFLAACVFNGSGPSGTSGDDSGDDDDSVTEPPDASPPDAPDVCTTWQPAVPFGPCSIAPDERGVELLLVDPGVYNYDTESGTLTAPGSATPLAHASKEIDVGDIPVRVVSAAAFQVGTDATLRVQGTIPLVVVSWGQISVQGTIDLSSSPDPSVGNGAGTGPEACIQGAPGPGLVGNNGGGGGGGSGFGGVGGAGGAGTSLQAGNAGTPGAAATGEFALRGGCPGAIGGLSDAKGVAAVGGPGGGAIALSALAMIEVSGTIHAGGGGGAGGTVGEEGGGGGGGSGGMIWLDARDIALSETAVLAANGGGGGGGSDSGVTPGEAGHPASTDGLRAVGGSGGDGGDGGQGSGDGEANGVAGVPDSDGGGGGGGAAGVIRLDGVLAASQAALITPSAAGAEKE